MILLHESPKGQDNIWSARYFYIERRRICLGWGVSPTASSISHLSCPAECSPSFSWITSTCVSSNSRLTWSPRIFSFAASQLLLIYSECQFKWKNVKNLKIPLNASNALNKFIPNRKGASICPNANWFSFPLSIIIASPDVRSWNNFNNPNANQYTWKATAVKVVCWSAKLTGQRTILRNWKKYSQGVRCMKNGRWSSPTVKTIWRSLSMRELRVLDNGIRLVAYPMVQAVLASEKAY